MVSGAAAPAGPAAQAASPAVNLAGRTARQGSPPAPVVVLVLSLSAVLLFCLKTGRLPGWLFVAALSAAALAGVFFFPPFSLFSRSAFSPLLLMCIALGVLVGAARLWPLVPLSLNAGRPVAPGGSGAGGLPRAGLFHSGLPAGQVRRFEAVLIRDSAAAPGEATRYELRVLRVMSAGGERTAGAAGKALLWIDGGPRLAAGRLVEVRGRLEAPAPGRPPALICHARPQDLAAGGYGSAYHFGRAKVQEGLRRSLGTLDPGVAATLEALVLGSREEVPPDLYDSFRNSGSLHLLALSGLHAGIVYLLVSLALAFVPRRTLRALVACTVLIGYLLLAGFRPSLFRAVAMILAALLGRVIDRDSRPLNLLALAALALLLIDPAAILSLSFQLSFLALAGILLFSPGLQRALEGALPRLAAAALAYSLAAQAATAPLLLARFGVVYPIGTVAALPLIPLVIAFIWLGLGYLALAGTVVAGPLAAVLLALHRVLRAVVMLFAGTPPLYGGAAVAVVSLLVGLLLFVRITPAARLRPA